MPFSTNTVTRKIEYNGNVIGEFENQITVEDMVKAVANAGIRGDFNAYDLNTGEPLSENDFPFAGDILVQPVNKAA